MTELVQDNTSEKLIEIEAFNVKSGGISTFKVEPVTQNHRGSAVVHIKMRGMINAFKKRCDDGAPVFYLLKEDKRFPDFPVVNDEVKKLAEINSQKRKSIKEDAELYSKAEVKKASTSKASNKK